MAKGNIKEDKHSSDLSPTIKIMASSLLLTLSLIMVYSIWHFDIYHNPEQSAKIVYREVHFWLGITICIFLNSIAFLKGNRIMAINIKSFTVILLLLFIASIPVYTKQCFFQQNFYCGILYFTIGIFFYLLFCKILEKIDFLILREDEQKSGENNEI